MIKKDIWDYLIWMSILIFVIYINAKLFGRINTKGWYDLISVISITFAIGVFYQKIMGFINAVYIRTNYLKNNIDILKVKFDDHEKRIEKIKKKK